MKIVHRFGFYMGGFSIGLVFLMFFLSGKKTSCAYGPDARVLKNIQTKRPQYSESVQEQLNSKIIDTLTLHSILKMQISISEKVIQNHSLAELTMLRVKNMI